MIEKIKQNFENSDNQLLIKELARKYNLSTIEYLSLVNILLYYFCVSNNPDIVSAIDFIYQQIIVYRDKIRKNQTGEFFTSTVKELIKWELQRDPNTLINLRDFALEGLLFHTFNSAFYDNINNHNLSVKDKPWNFNKLEQVKNILKKKKITNIFGLYKSSNNNPLFFSTSLASSPYYGLSSPTFYRKFIEHNPKYFNVFLNRDFNKAKESISELCLGLDEEDTKVIYDFFYEYWEMFATTELPYVAISSAKKLNVDMSKSGQMPHETDIEYYLRRITLVHNPAIQNDIPREQLDIFSYESLSFCKYTKEKSI